MDRKDFTAELRSVLEFDPETTAILTIDCHRGHLDPAVATLPVAADTAAAVVKNTQTLLEVARAAGVPVIHAILQYRTLPDGAVESLRNPFWQAVERTRFALTPDRDSSVAVHNLVGTPQTELMPELGPEPGDYVIPTKRRLSAFRDTDLEITLRELGTKTVVLAGINTNTCVLCAAFECFNRDLTTIVIEECTDSMYGDDLHHFALQNVARCLGWVLTLDEFTAKLNAAVAQQGAAAMSGAGTA